MKLTRIIVVLGLLGAVGWCGWRFAGVHVPDLWLGSEARAELEARRRLAADLPESREAEVRIVERRTMPDGRPRTRIEWREKKRRVAPDAGADLWHPPLHFTIEGEQPRFEALVMTFDAGQDPRENPLAGKSLVLFRRAYGEFTAPEDGTSFADPTRPVPQGYLGEGEPLPAEKTLWTRFWNLATDPVAARAEGIDVIQAKAVSTLVLPGKCYRITVDRTGRMDIRGPLDD